MKSGLAQLVEEKYRFTVETQGLAYTNVKEVATAKDEDRAWTDDDSDREEERKRRSPPLAQRMANGLTKVLQEGGSGGLTDDVLDRVLTGSLQQSSDVAGYDAAKDYVKQVLRQLYGDDAPSGAPPSRSNGPNGPHGGAQTSAEAAGRPHGVTGQTQPTSRASGGGSEAATWSGFPAARQQAPPQGQPGVDVAKGAHELQGLPESAAAGVDSFEATRSAPSASAGDAEEPERPRPRPHYGHIKEQLNLLQNADQLAAIISVATTAATTAAAAAVKQSMQTPPPLPPGAFARMHAAAQAARGASGAAAWPGHPAFMGAGAAMLGMPGLGGHLVNAVDGDDSPDPQPQQREGALVAPHRRSTPLVMMHRRPPAAAEGGGAAMHAAHDGAERHGPTQQDGQAAHVNDAELRRQRQQQRSGMPGAATPLQRLPGAAGNGDANGANGAGGPVGANSNIRVVRLGAPKVTVRTPPPAGAPQGRLFQEHQHQQQQPQADDPEDDDDRGNRGQLQFPGWASLHEHMEQPVTRPEQPNPVQQHAPAHYAPDSAAGMPPAAGQQLQDQQYGRHAEAAYPGSNPVVPGPQLGLQQAINPSLLPGQQAIAAGQVPANGVFVTGGESVFARAGADANAALRNAGFLGNPGAGLAAAAAARPRRAELPEDVQQAFKSTLAYIADPDGARAQQQHQPPSWAAMADVEERKEAQREAEELLGGAFDYAAAKRELKQAKRASRLLQVPVPTVPPAAAATAAAATAQAAPAGAVRSGVGSRGGGERFRASAAAAAAAGGAVGGAASAKAPPSSGATAGAVVRGDFAGVLPPAHSVWDVDEAWHDLDAFTKAVEAEVAYRAAAAAAGQPPRTAPALKPVGPNAGAVAAAGRAAQAEPPLVSESAGPRGHEKRTAGAQVSAQPRLSDGKDVAARDGGRKRAGSPGPGPRPEATAVADASPSPPRPERPSAQPAAASVRIAFGRRIEVAPKPSGATEGTKSRSKGAAAASSPPVEGHLHKRKTKVAGGKASAAVAAAAGSPSSANDTVQEVLSALASVLLSDEEEDVDEEGPHADTGAEKEHRAAVGGVQGAGNGVAAMAPPHVDMADYPPDAPSFANGGGMRSAASLILDSLHDRGQGGPGTDALAALPAPALRSVAPNGPPGAIPDEPQPASIASLPAGPSASSHQAAMSAAAAANAVAAPQPGQQPWPSIAVPAARPRFQLVVDTAHPPVARLPAWAASAAKAEGAPAAYIAALGAAPSGLGMGTPTRHAAVPSASAAAQPHVSVGGTAPPGAMMTSRGEQGSDGGVLPATKLPYTRMQQQQRPMFPASADLANHTSILPPQAAVAAVAATGSADMMPTRGRKAADASLPLERALMQAVEDEVVSRLAVAQLASQGPRVAVTAEDLPGMVPPLVDWELSQRLVREVLLDNLRGLLSRQEPSRQQDAAVGPGAEEREPTLEEVVAALVAAPVLPSWLQSVPQEQQQLLLQQGAGEPAEQQGWRQGPQQQPSDGAAGVEVTAGSDKDADGGGLAGNVAQDEPPAGVAFVDSNLTGCAADSGSHEAEVAGMAGAGAASDDAAPSEDLLVAAAEASFSSLVPTPTAAAQAAPQYSAGSMQTSSTGSVVQTGASVVAGAQGSQSQALALAGQSSGQVRVPTSAGVQAHGVQARGVQAHAVNSQGVQAYATEGRGVQAYAVEGRATQATGVQERATQAAGVMDSSSQADPPPPHYLLQAAMAAGLSYGAGLPLPPAPLGHAPAPPPLPLHGPDGAPLPMPRPYYLVPADGTQPPSSTALYGANPALMLPPFGRSEGSRPPLHLPGLAKLRDSSDVESSTESVRRHLQGPGARAREAALQLAASSIDSDEGLMQRSYAQLDMSALTARPVHLDQHRNRASDGSSPSAASQTLSTALGGPGHYDVLSQPAGLHRTFSQALAPGTAMVAGTSHNGSIRSEPQVPGSATAAALASALAARGNAVLGSGRNPSSASAAPSGPSSHPGSVAGSEGASWSRQAATWSADAAWNEQEAAGPDAATPGTGLQKGAATPAAASKPPSDRHDSASAGSNATTSRNGSAAASGKDAIATPHPSAPALGLRAGSGTAVPTTPAVGDDELVAEDDPEDDDDVDQIHVVDFGSSDADLDLVPDDSPGASPGAEAGRGEGGAQGFPSSSGLGFGAQNAATHDAAESDAELLDDDEVGRVLEAEDAEDEHDAAGEIAAGAGGSRGSTAGSGRYSGPSSHGVPRLDATGSADGEAHDYDGLVEDYVSSRDLGSFVSSARLGGGSGAGGGGSHGDAGHNAASGSERGGVQGSAASGAATTTSAATLGGNAASSRSSSRAPSSAFGQPGHALAPSLHSAGGGAGSAASGAGGSASEASGRRDDGNAAEEMDLRASLERMARAGFASLEHPRAAAGSGNGGMARVVPAVQTTLTGGPLAPSRAALTPLQPSAVQSGSVASGEGTMQQPGSPGKPPSLADYHGPMGRLWRPPVVQNPRDPLSSSSETLMASSEASEPLLDPLSRAIRGGERRTRTAGIVSSVTVAAARAHVMGLGNSIAASSVDVSASMDSVSTSVVSSSYNVAGVNLPRSLGGLAASTAGTQPGGRTAQRLARPFDGPGEDAGTEDESEDESEDEGRALSREATFARSAVTATTGAAFTGGRGSGRREDAVFRLRQFGARRRKLIQQIGVKDSLLMSSATSLSTDSSTSVTSEDGDGLGSLVRAGRF
ncbi:hypothetical protein Agub_g10454 [Astrephomene gubernaculifera]|uniref:Uncharacterized protein n=1 Tax=Astrephomene gubernaculifera TaxID=47775 RepID=A0AAD3DUX6_9CHLO|nr:hypothetical protein Agub_g10454 [Astrephomene gubernaculifera]